jgi:putative transposase
LTFFAGPIVNFSLRAVGSFDKLRPATLGRLAMARGPRLDAPGALHHVIGRGIERGVIFLDDLDREDFVGRVAELASVGAFHVYAWALMPNHFHLLVRTASRPLPRAMRALMSGYATWFNRRHHRAGHLFQNRYRSTLCEEEPYFLALIRYIHRNPIPSVVPDLEALARYPYSGHATILGTIRRKWQNREAVLRHFEPALTSTVDLYLRFMKDIEPTGSLDLDGGGLARSRAGYALVERLDKGRERFRSDERILGSPRFVDGILQDLRRPHRALHSLDAITDRVCQSLGVDARSVKGEGRARSLCRARAAIAYLWIHRLGGSIHSLARYFGSTDSPVRRAALRGAAEASRWEPLIDELGR